MHIVGNNDNITHAIQSEHLVHAFYLLALHLLACNHRLLHGMALYSYTNGRHPCFAGEWACHVSRTTSCSDQM